MTPKPSHPGPAERWVEHTVADDDAGRTLRDILIRRMHVSRRMIQRLTRGDGIRLNGRASFMSRKVRAGDVVAARVSTREESGLRPVAMELDVVYEDGDLLVVNKPPFLLTHPISPRHTRTLAHGIAHHFQQQGLQARVRPVHRLDRDTSGLLVVAKSPFVHQQLDRQLRGRSLRREYLAFVAGVVDPDAGEIDAPIGPHPHRTTLRATGPEGEEARTRFRVVERFADASLVELELDTGRTHQIRVHLAHLGHPLLGDEAYGGRVEPGLKRQALHAWRLAFRHPTTRQPVELTADLPDDLARLRERLRAPGG